MRRKTQLTAFGREINRRLDDLDMTQRGLAERVGCNPNYIWMIMRGMRSGDKHMAAICEALEIPYRTEKGA